METAFTWSLPPPFVTNCHTFSDPLPPLERDILYGRPLKTSGASLPCNQVIYRNEAKWYMHGRGVSIVSAEVNFYLSTKKHGVFSAYPQATRSTSILRSSTIGVMLTIQTYFSKSFSTSFSSNKDDDQMQTIYQPDSKFPASWRASTWIDKSRACGEEVRMERMRGRAPPPDVIRVSSNPNGFVIPFVPVL